MLGLHIFIYYKSIVFTIQRKCLSCTIFISVPQPSSSNTVLYNSVPV